ncbi:uncharacterized protein GGS25DRAFT_520485 [Hypoxylon fragiforme]|uniref:uncharacterized protein n=1 Tax=Hypoxylon fragiforme TaxID=63214 RepID=UPI0020C5C585|nr:uncharacterized protein GGS25DRAFT_520485 [Hypoxylon fragiforme]KAI2609680.1 hypothetical protein GGS25DRAFT_520485 [Hypoxylon fragiforme]
MLGRLLLTVDALGMCFGTIMADCLNETHMFNPRWRPHAKFHNAQTVFLAIILSLITLYYTWRPTTTTTTTTKPQTLQAELRLRREFLFVAALSGSIYWIAGLLSILPPGTMGLDPEFGGPGFPQAKIFVGFMAAGLAGAWLEYP